MECERQQRIEVFVLTHWMRWWLQSICLKVMLNSLLFLVLKLP